jgi:hypothetical protein
MVKPHSICYATNLKLDKVGLIINNDEGFRFTRQYFSASLLTAFFFTTAEEYCQSIRFMVREQIVQASFF